MEYLIFCILVPFLFWAALAIAGIVVITAAGLWEVFFIILMVLAVIEVCGFVGILLYMIYCAIRGIEP